MIIIIVIVIIMILIIIIVIIIIVIIIVIIIRLDFGPEPDRLPRLHPRVLRIPAAQYIYRYVYVY